MTQPNPSRRLRGLAPRLLAVLGGLVTLLLGVYSAWTVHAEAERIDAAHQARAHARLAELTRVAERIRGAHGLAAAQAALTSDEGTDRVALLTRAQRPAQLLAQGHGLLLSSTLPPGAAVPEARLYTWTPPSRRATAVRAMVLERVGLALLVLLVLVAAITLVVRLWVGAPVAALVAQVDRVAQGDWSGRVSLRGADEIGLLGARFDSMLQSLRATREALETESERRVRAVEGLRHAQRLKMMGQLTAGIAHELGTPLNVVKGRAKLIERDRLDPAQRAESARIIEAQCERMAELVRKLLSFARREGPPDQITDLRASVRTVGDLLQPALRKRGVTLALALGDAPLPVRAEHNHLEQVLSNLVFNGVDAMPDGGAVTVTTRRVTRAGAAQVCVEVADEGQGMAPAVAAEIFEPFFTTKALGAGTGLGLAVVHGIVDDLGGTIEVDSAPGEGTRMRVYLPEGAADQPSASSSA